MNNIRLILQAKQRRPIITPLISFTSCLLALFLIKAYFNIKQRYNFKNFLFDYNNRKEHLSN